MISRQDFFGWLAFAGAVLLFTGIIGLYISLSSFLLLYVGILMSLAGYYFYNAEIESELIINKQKTIHDLKCWPPYFAHILDGTKTFEHRVNDRDFKLGDTLYLREWSMNNGYSGREAWVTVTYILCGFGIPENHCIMSISKPWMKKEAQR